MASASILCKTTRKEVFELLTAYERYPEWVADVVHASVLSREGDIVVVELCSPWLMTDNYVLECVHAWPSSIVYKQVDQYGDCGLRGCWQLDEAPGGVVVAGELILKAGLRSWFSRRRKIALVLQRRLDAMQQVFSHRSLSRLEIFPS
jgi:hypothetical protein